MLHLLTLAACTPIPEPRPSTPTIRRPAVSNAVTTCPQVPDRCDGIDVDCDGQVDEDPEHRWYQDGDGDGGGDPYTWIDACQAPSDRWVAVAADCSDGNPAVTGARGPIHWQRLAPEVSGLDQPHWDGIRRQCGQEIFVGGAAIGDVDGDDDLDVFLPRVDLPDLLVLNDGTGAFTVDPTFVGDPGGSSGAVFFDAEGDADLDLYVVRLGTQPNLLYVNDGEGSFSEVAAQRGADRTPEGCGDQYGVSAVDVDGDGDLDLAIAAWQESWQMGLGQNRSGLLLNDGNGHFTEVTGTWGFDELDDRAPFALLFHDLDDDALPEMHVVADWQTSGLHANDGTFLSPLPDDTFTDESGMGADLGDVDGDGDLDWFVSSIYGDGLLCLDLPCTGNRLYGMDDGAYVDRTDAAGVRIGQWSWGAVFVDMDLDADLDLAVTGGMDWPSIAGFTGNVYRNDGTGAFEDATCEAGFDATGQGRTLLPFDMDRDGDLDLLLVEARSPPSVWEAVGAEGRGWLEIDLRQSGGNPLAIGARITVQPVEGGPTQVRLLHANSLYMGGPPPEVHVGLGDHLGSVYEVVVRWPDGEQTTHADVGPGRVTLVRDPPVR